MSYKVLTKKLDYMTKHAFQFINITKEVEDFIKESDVKTGYVIVQTHHTTCRVWVNEDEKNLIGDEKLDYEPDLKKVLIKFANPEEKYNHNDVKDVRNPKGRRDTHLCEPDENGVVHECMNAHAHAHAMIFPHAVTMIIEKGELVKGKWQQIMLVELDHDRPREVTLLVQGDS
jgi:thiamine phosphate synthase YjbQ (UPF0047 family)